MRFDAVSELQKEQFRRACEAADVSMSEILRDAMDLLIEEYTLGSDPDSLEQQAVELERTAEGFHSEAKELESESEQALASAEKVLREADQLRREASELRSSANGFEDDIQELTEHLIANPNLKVFDSHAKIVSIAQAHDASSKKVLRALVEAGVPASRVVGDI